MTDEVTEIPRCCSSRIQSEVAWRAALRPFTVPAIVMAPPNSRSFSVSVVLPASGCEMIAKVRRRRISASSSVMSLEARSGGSVAAQRTPENGGILATVGRLIVAAPHAYLLEAERKIQPDRRHVGRSDLEKGVGHAGSGGALDECAEQPSADSAATVALGDTQVEDVRLARAEAHHSIGHHLTADRDHAAHVADPQTVAEDALAPGELVRAALDADHLADIVAAHGADHDLGCEQLRSGCHRCLASFVGTRCGQTSDPPRPCACRPASAADKRDDT